MSRKCSPVPTAKVDALVTELQTIGDRLEAKRLPCWLTIARAAFILAGIRHGFTNTAQVAGINVERLVIDIEQLADGFEERDHPDYKPLTMAASLIEGIRLGITTIADDAPSENWFGVDLATGPDQTVRSTRHVN